MKILVVTLLLMLAAGPGIPASAAAEAGVTIEFSDREVKIIEAWYREHRDEGRHAKGKRKGLPPGIAKNLARGKALPPGIAMQALPDGLSSALPPPPRGFDRIVVDGKILLVEIATRVIHDVLVDAVLH